MADVFYGTFNPIPDDKVRIAIPAKFRDIVARSGDPTGLMITGWENALLAYTKPHWEKIVTRINSAPKSAELRRFIREFVGGAHECDFDSQGRVLIPPSLRKDTGIEAKKEIELLGVGDHIEIWSKERRMEDRALLQEDLKNKETAEKFNDYIS